MWTPINLWGRRDRSMTVVPRKQGLAVTRSRTRLVYLGKVANGHMGRYTLLWVYTTVLARYFTLQTGILDRSHTTDIGTHQTKH